MINLALSREIYGLNPWCVDQSSFPALMSILDNAKRGNKLELPEQKYNSVSVLNLESNEVRIIDETYQLENASESFTGIGVIKIDGVITVSGGASSRGMDQISSQMKTVAKDERIKSFIVLGNSGGGSTMAVEMMAKTITSVRKTKKVYGLVKEGGMMASACFGIMSACEFIWAESEMSTVGSAGTMIQFEGREANSEHEGVKYIRLYAPESDAKNKGFEDALNKNDYSIITDQMLKPVNDRFLSLLESNRPQLKGTNFRNGHTVFAKDAVGTFIDGIKSFSEVIEIASGEINIKEQTATTQESRESTESSKININPNNSQKMTKAEFKAANPDAYSEIVAEGVEQRTDQVAAWMVHVNTDATLVAEGISSSKNINQASRESFFVKQNSQNVLKAMKGESAIDLVTPESKALNKITNEKSDAELESAFKFELK